SKRKLNISRRRKLKIGRRRGPRRLRGVGVFRRNGANVPGGGNVVVNRREVRMPSDRGGFIKQSLAWAGNPGLLSGVAGGGGGGGGGGGDAGGGAGGEQAGAPAGSLRRLGHLGTQAVHLARQQDARGLVCAQRRGLELRLAGRHRRFSQHRQRRPGRD